jgi:hypothetical protein
LVTFVETISFIRFVRFADAKVFEFGNNVVYIICFTLINAVMTVQNKQVKFQLDCGSTVNVLPIKDYEKLFNDKELVQLKPSNQTLVMFNKTETKPAGKRKITIVNPKNKKWYTLEFVVVNGNVQPILGSEAIQQMKLITVTDSDFFSTLHSTVSDLYKVVSFLTIS